MSKKVKKRKVKKTGQSKISNILAKYISKISLLAVIIAGVSFYLVFKTFPMFPPMWATYLLIGLLVVILLVGFVCLWPKIHYTGKILTMVLNFLICICLGIGCWYLPHIRAQIEKAFAEVPIEGEAEINFYVLKNDYTPPTEDGDLAENISEDNEETTEKVYNIADYKEATFIIQESTDVENQEYAMLVLKREMMVDEVKTFVVSSIFDAVDALKEGKGDVMVLNVSYLPMIEDITGYEDFSNSIDKAYTVFKKLQISTLAESVDVTTKPFNIMIVGNDSFGSKVNTTGRTDVNMVASVNPITKQITFITIPRDAYVPNTCLYKNDDKLTHVGIYGIKCTEETIENYLGIQINYYVVINFSSLIKMVDALGGIDINNPYKFSSNRLKTWKGTFQKGEIHLNGKQALVYCRERYNVTGGDFGRAAHQTIVIKAMIEKMTQPAIITRVDTLLESLSGTFKTNISMEEIYALAQMQLDDMAVWNIVNYSLTGSTGQDVCASMGTTRKFSVVYVNKKQLAFVKRVIKSVQNGEIITQEKLPS